jgi:transcriptional regulator with XRE-family HTH domain
MIKEDYKVGLRRRYLAVFDEVVAKQGVTDKDIADKIGISNSHISQMRSGNRYPTTEQVLILCDTYGYDLAYVIRGRDKAAIKRPADGATLDDIYKELQELKQVVSGGKAKK